METVIKKPRINDIRLSCNVLKTAACVIMLIDHIGYGIIRNYMNVHKMDMMPAEFTRLQNIYDVCNGIGRLAFPIFAFFLVEGFIYTKNIAKYMLRLLVFAVISELPFDLGLFGIPDKWDHQNILLTFFVALVMLVLIKYIQNNVMGLSSGVVRFASISIVVAFCQLSQYIHTDYSWKCMLLVAVLYFTRDLGPFELLGGAAASCWEKYAPAAFALLYFYDPEVRPKYKYAFYIFYPLHLFIIYLIARLVI